METKNIYPEIDELLIKSLQTDFPNVLPKTEISGYALGYLIGQQSIIAKLEFEMQKQQDLTTEE